MLEHNTEMKIVKLLLGIANGDKKIDKIKINLHQKYNLIKPYDLFTLITNNNTITCENIMLFLSSYNIHCSVNEAKMIIYFYDSDQDNELNYIEFLNLLLSDSDYIVKKVEKKNYLNRKLSSNNFEEGNKCIITALVELLENEIEFAKYICELICEIKESDDFTMQDMFHVLKSYSYVTNESVKAFFDRNGIVYDYTDISAIFNRLDSNKDGKICFNELKYLFMLANMEETQGLMSSSMNKGVAVNYNNYGDISMNSSGNDNLSNRRRLNHFHHCPNDDGTYQFECSHLSNSMSPVGNNRHNNKSNNINFAKMPIVKESIKDGSNCNYKGYMKNTREKSLSRSQSRSLSRSSDYQSPGENIPNHKDNTDVHNIRTIKHDSNIMNNSFQYNSNNNLQSNDNNDGIEYIYCKTDQPEKHPIRLGKGLIITESQRRILNTSSNNNTTHHHHHHHICNNNYTNI